ncbi:SIR2 family protein [Macellibacteroides fermentans]|uniref:SIR2 family protein n=1 Tax=Macellibacteroides fermentans TaxID=879969 RepID=UPI00406CB700
MNKYKPSDVIPELRELHNRNALIPFIGAGFSIPLSLPSWSELMGNLGIELGYEKEIFLKLGTYQQLAEYVNINYSREWKAFLLKLATMFNSPISCDKRRKSDQHKALADLNFKTIYTTNYDLHIEESIKDCGKKAFSISSYEDFTLAAKLNDYDCEVLKFHGTIEDNTGIVLTESQYFGRMGLEGAIDQRLRSDVLTKSFLFIGYSFSDPNIRYIFYKLQKLREQMGTKTASTNSYFTSFGTNDIQSILLKQWNIKVIELDPSNKDNSVAEFLKSLK